LHKSFKIKKPRSRIEENVASSSKTEAIVHHRTKSELELRIFGSKVIEQQDALSLELRIFGDKVVEQQEALPLKSENSSITKDLSELDQTVELMKKIAKEIAKVKDLETVVEDLSDDEP
jgi:hypothetical protein